jgi:cation:H+ antiporter
MILHNPNFNSMEGFGGFFICALLIFFAGKRLSEYGDKIGDKTGVGKTWIGLVLMATVTSLPELFVGISSSAIIESADLAVGDIVGSCAFNLAILAFLDVFIPKRQHLFYVASSHHVLSTSLGTILIALAGVSIYLPEQIALLPGIGVMSVVFIVIYFISIRVIYKFEKQNNIHTTSENLQKETSLSILVISYAFFALIIIAAALLIPYFATLIAKETGLTNSAMGTVFVSISTSLPEIAVSIASVRIGSIDLAIGNLLGSNIFNILILSIDDIFYKKGLLLKDVSDNHLMTVLTCIIMGSVTIAGFTYKAPAKKFLMALDSILILAFYFLNLVMVFYLQKP